MLAVIGSEVDSINYRMNNFVARDRWDSAVLPLLIRPRSISLNAGAIGFRLDGWWFNIRSSTTRLSGHVHTEYAWRRTTEADVTDANIVMIVYVLYSDDRAFIPLDITGAGCFYRAALQTWYVPSWFRLPFYPYFRHTDTYGMCRKCLALFTGWTISWRTTEADVADAVDLILTVYQIWITRWEDT